MFFALFLDWGRIPEDDRNQGGMMDRYKGGGDASHLSSTDDLANFVNSVLRLKSPSESEHSPSSDPNPERQGEM